MTCIEGFAAANDVVVAVLVSSWSTGVCVRNVGMMSGSFVAGIRSVADEYGLPSLIEATSTQTDSTIEGWGLPVSCTNVGLNLSNWFAATAWNRPVNLS